MLLATSFSTAHLLTRPQLDIPALVVIVGAAAAYFGGLRKLEAIGRAWPIRRTRFFVGGLVALAVALLSGLARYNHVFFTAHVAADLLIGMIGPGLLALGAPVTLALEATEGRGHDRLQRALASPVATVLTNPVVVWILFLGSSFALYFERGLYQPNMHLGLVSELVHLELLVVGFVFFVPVVALDPVGRQLTVGGRFMYLMAGLPLYTILGMALVSSQRTLAGNMTITDLQTGGGIAWTAGEFLSIGGGAALLYVWLKSEERLARAEDRALEARLALRAEDADPDFGPGTDALGSDPGRPAGDRGQASPI